MNLIIKGIIVGIGKILPGISGSLLAISLGIYEQLIEKIANFRKDIYNNLKYLTKICIGIIIAITLTSKIVVNSFNKYYFATMLLFVGLMIGGMPNIIKQTRIKKNNIFKTIILIISTIIITNINYSQNHQVKYTIIEFIKLIGVGIIDAASSIIPGISGTAILMTIGYYNIIIQTFASITNKNNIYKNIFILLPFMIGYIIGIIILSKIIYMLIKKDKNMINIIIIILMSSSIIIILKNTIPKAKNVIEIIIGIILFIIGFIISIKIENKNTKK